MEDINFKMKMLTICPDLVKAFPGTHFPIFSRCPFVCCQFVFLFYKWQEQFKRTNATPKHTHKLAQQIGLGSDAHGIQRPQITFEDLRDGTEIGVANKLGEQLSKHIQKT